jgi:hypothetical protein
MTILGSAAVPAILPRRANARCADYQVEVVTDYQAFLALEPVWNTLVSEAGLEHPFLEHVWVRTWWECFGAGSAMHIVVVKSGGCVVAIAPLILTPIWMYGVPLRCLGLFYNSHVPRAEFIVARGSEQTYAAIWNHLEKDSSWDVLQLCQLEEGSQTLHATARLAALSGRRVETWISSECPYIPIRTPWNEYFSGLATKHRANLRNRMRRLLGQGLAGMETVDSEAGLVGALEEGLRLEAAAWKGEAGTAISCDPRLARFYSLLAQRTAERGWLRLNFLRSDSERIAFDYSLAYRGRIFLLKHGYDPAYSQFSPSQLLLQFALEKAFEECDEYEILGDRTDWKQCWTKNVKKHYWLFVFADNLKARFVHTAKFRLAPMAKRVMNRGGAN